jgi:hypothetical protein
VTPQENRAIITRYLEESWNNKNSASLLFGGNILNVLAERDIDDVIKIELRQSQSEVLLPK